MRKINIVAFSLLIAAATLGAQELSTKKSLNLAVTKVIVAAVEKEATKNGWAMFIAVVDDGGVLTTVERNGRRSHWQSRCFHRKGSNCT